MLELPGRLALEVRVTVLCGRGEDLVNGFCPGDWFVDVKGVFPFFWDDLTFGFWMTTVFLRPSALGPRCNGDCPEDLVNSFLTLHCETRGV